MVNHIPPQRPGFQTRKDFIPHPSLGRGESYSPDMRDLVLSIHDIGNIGPALQDFINVLQQ